MLITVSVLIGHFKIFICKVSFPRTTKLATLYTFKCSSKGFEQLEFKEKTACVKSKTSKIYIYRYRLYAICIVYYDIR